MTRRLLRAQDDRMIGGVCGGLGRYLGLDPVLVRLAFVLFTLAGGAGALIYLVLLIVMPLDTSGQGGSIQGVGSAEERQQRTTMLVGGGLVLIGLWYLLAKIPGLAWLSFANLWPLLLIAFGVLMIVGYLKSREV